MTHEHHTFQQLARLNPTGQLKGEGKSEESSLLYPRYGRARHLEDHFIPVAWDISCPPHILVHGTGISWERCLSKAYREDHREWVNLKSL